jgi:hypothetical protein
MRTAIYYARQSDPANNANFRRVWVEPQRRRRVREPIVGATNEKPPDRLSRKRRRAAPATGHRPIIKTTAAKYRRPSNNSEARRDYAALFVSGGSR